jgi:hypothetical protein
MQVWDTKSKLIFICLITYLISQWLCYVKTLTVLDYWNVVIAGLNLARGIITSYDEPISDLRNPIKIA